jgi:hypothetical protein
LPETRAPRTGIKWAEGWRLADEIAGFVGLTARAPTWSLDRSTHSDEGGIPEMLWLVVAIILLVIAIAGGAIIHPILFALGIVALVLFFMHFRRGSAAF